MPSAGAGSCRPVLLDVTEQLEFMGMPSHVEDLKRYRDRGYVMRGNRIRIVTDRPMEVVNSGVRVDHYPPRPLPIEER